MKSHRFWIVALGLVVLACAAAAFALRQGRAERARIYLDGELIETIDLSAVAEPYTLVVESDGGENVIAVENGRIRVLEADCPDGACVRQGWIGNGVTPIVCLPHGLVIELDRGKKQDIDAVAR